MRAHTSFIGRKDFNGRLVTVVYYETRTFLMRRRYFIYVQIFCIDANISKDANISVGANISWARIFHWREHFDVSEYLCVNYYFRQAPIFDDFAVSSASSIFAISFA